MKPSELLLTFKVIEKSGISLFIEGPPGIGKSQMAYQFAKSSERNLIEIRPAQWDATEVKGIPTFKTNEDGEIITVWTRPGYLPRRPRSILLVEELDKAAPSIQSAMLELILDRRIGNFPLPEDCMVIATANRLEDRSGSYSISKALGNRFLNITLEPDNGDWEKWALAHNIGLERIAFLRWRPQFLHRFDPSEKSAIFASPRQWELLDKDLKALDEIPEASELRQQITNGHIGPEIGAEYIAFERMYKELPDPRKIDADPDSVPAPRTISAMYAVSTALSKSATPENIAARLAYLKKFQDNGTKAQLKEFALIFMRTLTSLKSAALSTPAATAWILENKDILEA